MNHHEIVCELVGPIDPVGEVHTDEDRLKNLGEMLKLVHCLLLDIERVAKVADSHMHSVSVVGKTAAKALKLISEVHQ